MLQNLPVELAGTVRFDDDGNILEGELGVMVLQEIVEYVPPTNAIVLGLAVCHFRYQETKRSEGGNPFDVIGEEYEHGAYVICHLGGIRAIPLPPEDPNGAARRRLVL